MSNWAPGDLAMRVRVPDMCSRCGYTGVQRPGWVGKVSAVQLINYWDGIRLALFFEGEADRDHTNGCWHEGFNPLAYRKIDDLTDEEKRRFTIDVTHDEQVAAMCALQSGIKWYVGVGVDYDGNVTHYTF